MYRFILLEFADEFDYEKFKEQTKSVFDTAKCRLEEDATDYVLNLENTLDTVEYAMSEQDKSLRPQSFRDK